MTLLEISGVSKRFGATVAVYGVSLCIERGEFSALLGPSGCGKTTLLRLIAGFEVPDAGRIVVDGADVTELPPYERPVTSDFCPFQRGNLCTAREPRPLGCRVYYCDPNYQETANRISEVYLRRLKDLADAEGVAWHYAPLHHFLNNPDGATAEPPS